MLAELAVPSRAFADTIGSVGLLVDDTCVYWTVDAVADGGQAKSATLMTVAR